MPEIKPPQPLPTILPPRSLFLGGTIDMGGGERWQERVVQGVFARFPDALILNPRREEWDASWKAVPENPEFAGQVRWEMEGQERAGVRVYYFAENSRSPITLLELGKYGTLPTLVFCPPGFYRSGNVALFCERYRIPCFAVEREWMDAVLHALLGLALR
ncbi:MAG TPA: nucleoside 2-deoxyribosyltransferase domain-containing protein [Candidatus Methylacidiphilales bacterium]